MNWFWIIYFMVKGLGDKTIGHGSTYNATFCYFNLRDQFNLGVIDLPTYAVGLDFTSFVTTITTMFQKVDPMFKKCTDTYEDYKVTALAYGKAFTDMLVLGLNFAYHTPHMYRAIDSLVNSFMQGFDNNASDYYYDIGTQFGLVLYWAFYDINDYEYPTLDV